MFTQQKTIRQPSLERAAVVFCPTAYYHAGLTGEDMGQVYNRYAWALTAPQKQAAYRAGQQDVAVFAERGKGGADRGQTLGRELETTMPPVSDRSGTLTGQQDSAILSPEEAKDTLFSSETDELQGRYLQYEEGREFERDTGRITARRVKNFSENNLFVQDGVKLSKAEFRRINKLISQAKSLMEIAESCNIPIVISHTQNSIAAYNPRTDVIFIDPQFGEKRVSWKLQGRYVCPDHPLSTLVHEMFHWKDAYEYRQGGNDIYDAGSLSAYTSAQRKICERKLRELGVDLDDVARMGREVSPYARDRLLKNEYEEVLAEYRTYLLLKGGH